MTRDELIADLTTEIRKVIPDNEELDSDSIDTVETVTDETLQNAKDALDEDDETGEEDADAGADGKGDTE